MNEEIRCPHCKGDKLQEKGFGEYKCMYCGGTFKHTPQSSNQENNANVGNVPSNNPNVIVNVGQSSVPQNSFANGAAQGAGAAAGGCLTMTAISIGAPILFFLWLMSQCS